MKKLAIIHMLLQNRLINPASHRLHDEPYTYQLGLGAITDNSMWRGDNKAIVDSIVEHFEDFTQHNF